VSAAEGGGCGHGGDVLSCGVQVCPLLKGAGVGTVVMSFLLATYYNVIMAWALFYLFSSFTSSLPWETCDNHWNSPNCRPIIQTNGTGTVLTILVCNSIKQIPMHQPKED